MNVLIVNDDGIRKPGLWALTRKLKQVADVLVVAPDQQQTGVGTSITLRKPLKVKKVRSQVKGVEAYSVKGTPTDSVIVGMCMIGENNVDLVVSGINEGPNMGKDVFVSATVGAALHAHNRGIPALALSLAAIENMNFEITAKLAAILTQHIAECILPHNILLNINVPNVPLIQIKGIDITRLGDSGYSVHFEVKESDNGYKSIGLYDWIMPGETEFKEDKGTDIWTVQHNRISITPIHSRITNHDEIEHLPTICSRLSQELSGGNIAVSDHLTNSK